MIAININGNKFRNTFTFKKQLQLKKVTGRSAIMFIKVFILSSYRSHVIWGHETLREQQDKGSGGGETHTTTLIYSFSLCILAALIVLWSSALEHTMWWRKGLPKPIPWPKSVPFFYSKYTWPKYRFLPVSSPDCNLFHVHKIKACIAMCTISLNMLFVSKHFPLIYAIWCFVFP